MYVLHIIISSVQEFLLIAAFGAVFPMKVGKRKKIIAMYALSCVVAIEIGRRRLFPNPALQQMMKQTKKACVQLQRSFSYLWPMLALPLGPCWPLPWAHVRPCPWACWALPYRAKRGLLGAKRRGVVAANCT